MEPTVFPILRRLAPGKILSRTGRTTIRSPSWSNPQDGRTARLRTLARRRWSVGGSVAIGISRWKQDLGHRPNDTYASCAQRAGQYLGRTVGIEAQGLKAGSGSLLLPFISQLPASRWRSAASRILDPQLKLGRSMGRSRPTGSTILDSRRHRYSYCALVRVGCILLRDRERGRRCGWGGRR